MAWQELRYTKVSVALTGQLKSSFCRKHLLTRFSSSLGRLAESSPHTMHEDRVILESLLAKNRNAIIDLYSLADVNQHSQSSSSSSGGNPDKAGTHRRTVSTTTGVEIPDIPDVLPPYVTKEKNMAVAPPPIPSRRFSKRRAHLGVHTSLLDMGSSQQAPDRLREKWIQRSRSTRGRGGLGTSPLRHLNKITETDRSAENTSPCDDDDDAVVAVATRMGGAEADFGKTCEPSQGNKENAETSDHSGAGDGEDDNTTNAKRVPGDRLHRVLQRLSLSSGSTTTAAGVAAAASEKQPLHLDLSKVTRRLSVKGLSRRRSPLRTPDFDQEFDNGV